MARQQIHSNTYQHRPDKDQPDTFLLVERAELQEQGEANRPNQYPNNSVPRAFDLFHVCVFTSKFLLTGGSVHRRER
jgi:hypothetical protein